MNLPPAPSKSARAYDDLRERIVTMRLRPGERLIERDLCDDMGLSRTPFRDAVRRLAQEGLVTVVPSDATFVNRIVLRQAVVGHFVRANLEVPAARLAAERAGTSDLRALRHVVERMADAAVARDADLSFALDNAFHRLIFAAAGMEDAWHLVHGATGQLDRLRRWVYPAEPGFFEETLAEHGAIFAALDQADGPSAAAAMRVHLDDTIEVPTRIMSEDPAMIDSGVDDLQMFASVIRSA